MDGPTFRPGRRASTWYSLAAACCAIAASPADAQEPQRIAAIEIEGLVDVSETYVREVIRARRGDVLDRPTLDEDVRRLLGTGKFVTAEYAVEQRDEGAVVTFRLAERPTIQAIRFSGNVKFNEKKLLEQVPAAVGDPIDSFGVQEGREGILGLYRQKGYGNVGVEIDQDLLRDSGELVYVIEEGVRVRIKDIRFEGNAAIPVEELTKHVESKAYFPIFQEGIFDVDTVTADAAALQTFYRDEGFLDARASYRVEPGAKPRDLIVVFTVDEGQRYQVETVDLVGNDVYNDAELFNLMQTAAGRIVLQRHLEHDVKIIQERYWNEGYIYAEVRAQRAFSETPNFVHVTFEITEGGRYRVGRIIVRGNEKTKDKVVRRALDLFPPDDWINVGKLRDGERDLVQTRIFQSATITPVGEDDAAAGGQEGSRDLVINVEEDPRAGELLFGAGLSSNSGLVGNITLDLRNFDIFDWPRSFTEFIKLRSFQGAGQRLEIELQPGTEFSRFRVDFTEPYFLDQPLRFGTGVYWFTRDRDAYHERRVGTNVSFGRRLKGTPLEDWYGELAFRLEHIQISDVDLFDAKDIREVEGGNGLFTIKGTLVRDKTDSRMLPTTGDRLRFSYEQGAGGGIFGKFMGDYTWHKTMHVDAEERKHVLSLKLDAGYIFGDAPVYERFYAGGIGSLRGFDFRGISPRDGLRDDAVGGNFLALAGAEYTFPIYGELLRGVLFTDLGTVEEDFTLTTLRASIGFGVRLQIDFLGPVPLEFDLAWPISSDENDDEQVFSFFIGATF